MKKPTPLEHYGVAAFERSRWWSDSKQRPVWASSVFLFLGLFSVLASGSVYAQASKLVNISSRLQCQTGDAVLVSEFVIQGGTDKQVLVRAIGPSLGIPGTLQDPTMELLDSTGTLIRANDNWRDSQQAEIQASGLAPNDDRESAIVATLAPGMYVTVIRGVSNTTGFAVSEIYDLDSTTSSLTAIGTRGLVQTGNNVLISGVILSGSQPQDVLVRALGPSLTNSGLPGALTDPTLELRDGNGALLLANDNWRDSQETAIQNSGLAPSNDLESAIILTIQPGAYTAILRGANNGTGLGFVQYYVLPYSGSALNPAPLPPPPTIISPLSVSGTVGQPFVYQFVASGALGVSNPPPGLGFNSALHAIIGTPTASGTFQTGLSATNSAGTATATLTTTVQQLPSSGPGIITSTAATGRTGSAFTFQVATSGGGSAARVSAIGLPAGLSIDPLTGRISGTPTTDGSSAVTLTVTSGNQTTSSILQLTFSSDPALPVITSANSASLTPGQSFTYVINAPSTAGSSDPTAFTLIGNLPNGLTFNSQTGTISGTFTGAFARQALSPDAVDLSGGIVTNVQLFATNSHGTTTIPLIFYLGPTGAVNISTRALVGSDDNVLIAGFIITGNAPKEVIIRAIGPSLPVPSPLPDPTLELHDATGMLAFNNDWKDSQEDEIRGTGVPPTRDLESAILAYLNPGPYTAIVRGNNTALTTTGIAVVEVYDLGTASLDTSSKAQLAQISTRGNVLTDDDVMIGGFIISGQATEVVVRAIGPSLSGFGISGALQDPTLALKNADGATLMTNDDWQQGQPDEIQRARLAPSDPRESALIMTLPPAQYTAIVSGKKDNTTGEATIGVGLVEVYVLQ